MIPSVGFFPQHPLFDVSFISSKYANKINQARIVKCTLSRPLVCGYFQYQSSIDIYTVSLYTNHVCYIA